MVSAVLVPPCIPTWQHGMRLSLAKNCGIFTRQRAPSLGLDSPRAQAARFSKQDQELDAPYRCVQNAGDILIIPYMWSHSVVNLQESIGIAVQFELKRKFQRKESGSQNVGEQEAVAASATGDCAANENCQDPGVSKDASEWLVVY